MAGGDAREAAQSVTQKQAEDLGVASGAKLRWVPGKFNPELPGPELNQTTKLDTCLLSFLYHRKNKKYSK